MGDAVRFAAVLLHPLTWLAGGVCAVWIWWEASLFPAISLLGALLLLEFGMGFLQVLLGAGAAASAQEFDGDRPGVRFTLAVSLPPIVFAAVGCWLINRWLDGYAL